MPQEKLVYLAGPITGLTYADAQDWRDFAKVQLAPHIVALSPLRCKQYLSKETSLDAMGYSNHPLSSPKGITSRDRFDCQRADAIIFNFLGAKRVSVGTCVEIGWADAARRPMVAVMEKDNIHHHAIVNDCVPYIVPTLSEAIEIVKAILLP